jgi:hypothetical protein
MIVHGALPQLERIFCFQNVYGIMLVGRFHS